MASKGPSEPALAAPTVPDERRLRPNQARFRDPHHMGDTGCYFNRPVALPPQLITLLRPFTPERLGDLQPLFTCCMLMLSRISIH